MKADATCRATCDATAAGAMADDADLAELGACLSGQCGSACGDGCGVAPRWQSPACAA